MKLFVTYLILISTGQYYLCDNGYANSTGFLAHIEESNII